MRRIFCSFPSGALTTSRLTGAGAPRTSVLARCSMRRLPHAIQEAEKTTGRQLHFSICEWGSQNPWFWGPGVGEIESTLWRTGGDIIPPVVESLHDAEHDKRIITAKNVLESFEAGVTS